MTEAIEKKGSALATITSKMEITFDDVVSAFVSDWEQKLFGRKKELQDELHDLNKRLETLIKDTEDALTGTQFTELPKNAFSLYATVNSKRLNWAEKEVVYTIKIKSKDGHNYHNDIDVNRSEKIPSANVIGYNKLTDEINEVQRDLAQTLDAIKSIPRKEREVRGKLAVKKFKDQGYDDLMQEPELAALVHLE